jgi:hypothetical protein
VNVPLLPEVTDSEAGCVVMAGAVTVVDVSVDESDPPPPQAFKPSVIANKSKRVVRKRWVECMGVSATVGVASILTRARHTDLSIGCHRRHTPLCM